MAFPKYAKPDAKPLPPVQPPLVSRRTMLLALEGAGPSPCLTAARTWVGCVSSTDSDDTCLATGKHCCMALFDYTAWKRENATLIEERRKEWHDLMIANKPRQFTINTGSKYSKKVG